MLKSPFHEFGNCKMRLNFLTLVVFLKRKKLWVIFFIILTHYAPKFFKHLVKSGKLTYPPMYL